MILKIAKTRASKSKRGSLEYLDFLESREIPIGISNRTEPMHTIAKNSS